MQTCDNAIMSVNDLQAVSTKMAKIRSLEYGSDIHMATIVLQRNLKSLIVGNGIRRWHPNGFLSRFTLSGTKNTG